MTTAIYILQKSLGDMVAERDALVEACQPIYEAMERGEMPEDYELGRVQKAMRRYNRRKK